MKTTHTFTAKWFVDGQCCKAEVEVPCITGNILPEQLDIALDYSRRKAISKLKKLYKELQRPNARLYLDGKIMSKYLMGQKRAAE